MKLFNPIRNTLRRLGFRTQVRQTLSSATASESGALAHAASPDIEAAACIQVMDVLSVQLDRTAKEIEQAVVRISGGISAMAAKARAIVDQSESARRSQETLDGVLKKARSALQQIDLMAEEARIVGINGQLEAVRAGATGAAFKVVASETTKLAGDASETSSSIQFMLSELKGIHRSLLDSLSMSERMSGELSREFNNAIVTLQFQDRVNQQLEHVSHMLTLMKQQLSTGFAASPAAKSRFSEWNRLMQSRATMESERATVVSGSHDVDPNAAGSVELF